MNNVIDIRTKQPLTEHIEIDVMARVIDFQKEVSNLGGLTNNLIDKGIPLFNELLSTVKEPRVQLVANRYLRHLLLMQNNV